LNPGVPRVKSERGHATAMVELLRSNDLVMLSYVRALLQSEHIGFVGLDEHMNMMDGNIGAIPRRLMVDNVDLPRARQLLRDAGLGHVLAP
jgi:hypothetical protein